MWQHMQRVLGYLVVSGIAAVMAGTFLACTFDPPTLPGRPPSPEVDFNDGKWIPEEVNILMQTAPLTTPTSELAWATVNGKDETDTDNFESYHGYACGQAERVWTQDADGNDRFGFRILGSQTFKDAKDHGMVLLNGWRVKYLHSDHDVRALGVAIHNVRPVGAQLHWEATIALADVNADDAIEGCYYYTAVMWNTDGPKGINAYVVQGDQQHDMTFIHPEGERAGLRTLSGEFHADQPKAVVPRGYGFILSKAADINVLQLGFDLDTNLWTTRDTISWDSSLIFKDNSTRSFQGTAIVSVLGNPGVEMVRSSLPLTPRRATPCPGTPAPTLRSEWKSVRALPYDRVVPVLVGYDIGDACNDNNLQEAGAWIARWNYVKTGATGTLHYQVESVFRDKDDRPGSHTPGYKVNILGFSENDAPRPYVVIKSQACCGWSGQYLGVDPSTGAVGMYANPSQNTRWRPQPDGNVLRLQTLVGGAFFEWYLDISTTSGTVKLLNHASHSGTKWRQEDATGFRRLVSLSSGAYNGQYLSLSTTSGTLRMHDNPSHSGTRWVFE